MPGLYTEADYENSIIELFKKMDYDHVYGPNIERDFYSPFYEEILEESLHNINRGLSYVALQEAINKLKNIENGSLEQKNIVFMDYLQNGITVKIGRAHV